MILEERNILTLLSLSLGGSWGSDGESFEDGGEGALGLSLGAESSNLGFSWAGLLAFAFSSGFSFLVASALLVGDSDGATCAWSLDFEIVAILAPGSTVSPTLAKSWS